MEAVELREGELLLRPWRPDDAEAVYQACQDPLIPRWTTVPSPFLHEHARDFVTATSDATSGISTRRMESLFR